MSTFYVRNSLFYYCEEQISFINIRRYEFIECKSAKKKKSFHRITKFFSYCSINNSNSENYSNSKSSSLPIPSFLVHPSPSSLLPPPEIDFKSGGDLKDVSVRVRIFRHSRISFSYTTANYYSLIEYPSKPFLMGMKHVRV